MKTEEIIGYFTQTKKKEADLEVIFWLTYSSRKMHCSELGELTWCSEYGEFMFSKQLLNSHHS